MTKQRSVRAPIVAGAFYPADEKELKGVIESFLSQVPKETSVKESKVLFVPHAGYIYSGQIAAYSFKQIDPDQIKRVIILGTAHQVPVSGVAISSATAWATSLGEVEVDKINKDLANFDFFEINNLAHEQEHSIEVELPFLQVVAPQAKIVPLIVGYLTAEQLDSIKQTLTQYLDQETLIMVSVDLSHYHSYNEAVELDNFTLDVIKNLSISAVPKCEIDSPGAVALVIEMARDFKWQTEILKYANSGDITGDRFQVVGYAAIAFISQK